MVIFRVYVKLEGNDMIDNDMIDNGLEYLDMLGKMLF